MGPHKIDCSGASQWHEILAPVAGERSAIATTQVATNWGSSLCQARLSDPVDVPQLHIRGPALHQLRRHLLPPQRETPQGRVSSDFPCVPRMACSPPVKPLSALLSRGNCSGSASKSCQSAGVAQTCVASDCSSTCHSYAVRQQNSAHSNTCSPLKAPLRGHEDYEMSC